MVRMQFSSGPYYSAMDRESFTPLQEQPKLEKPILAVDEIGVTVPEKHPVTGGHILQNVEAAIREGASKMQITFTTPHVHPMGGRPKAYGSEVRESLRELTRVNGVMIEGVEMPTSSMTNLAGFDPERGIISERRRQQDLQEVKEAIKFIGDISGGGGVDVYSQEFQRGIVDAPWNKKGKWAGQFESYEDEDKYASEFLVDTRTGQVHEAIRHSTDLYEPVFAVAEEDRKYIDVDGNPATIKKGDWVDAEGRWIDPRKPEHLLNRVPKWDEKNKKFEVQRLDWEEVKRKTDDYNKRLRELGEKEALDPAEFAYRLSLQSKWLQARGQSLYHTQRYDSELKQLEALKRSLEYYKKVEESMPEDEMWRLMREDPAVSRYVEYAHGRMMKPSEVINQQLESIRHSLKHTHEACAAADAQAEEVQRTMHEGVVRSMKKFAKDKAVDSYAEAGISALDETEQNPNVERPIHVGPELGWPAAYGGHPEEFIELIKTSRKQMAERLVKERGYSRDEAEETAERHIQGCFDTSHLGMWFQHFRKKHPRETEKERLNRFNKWFLEMTDKMQAENVIGSVQAVDSASGAHGHLPPGQGIFPVVEAVDHLKKSGFTGAVISEGHEEEQFGKGRILLETWRAFGSEIADSYFAAAPAATRWTDVSQSYFGHVNPPPYVVGAYRPTDDWVFWSGVPLE